jgi:hypothetical protein
MLLFISVIFLIPNINLIWRFFKRCDLLDGVIGIIDLSETAQVPFIVEMKTKLIWDPILTNTLPNSYTSNSCMKFFIKRNS